MTTVNGCWNCKYGGIRKLLHNLMFSFPELVAEITGNQHLVIKEILSSVCRMTRKCNINTTLNVEPGFICESWKYDEKGYKAKEPSYTEDKIMQER